MDRLLVDFDAILSLSPVNVYWLDRNNIYQGCNDTMAHIFGLFSRSDIIGKKNDQLPVCIKNPVLANEWDNANLTVMETGKQLVLEENVTLMDGTRAVFLSHKMPLCNKDNVVIGLLGISTNITNLKLNERKLREEKERAEFTLEYIISHLPAHVYWKDKNGVYLGSNDEQARSLGLHCGSELVGKTDAELPWGAEKAGIFRENDLEVMGTGVSITTEEPSIVKRQSATVLSHKVPLKTRDGEVIGVIGISIDITDRKKAEEL